MRPRGVWGSPAVGGWSCDRREADGPAGVGDRTVAPPGEARAGGDRDVARPGAVAVAAGANRDGVVLAAVDLCIAGLKSNIQPDVSAHMEVYRWNRKGEHISLFGG